MASARDFFDIFVLPAVEDWRADTSSIRKAMDVACHINALADHYWHEHSSVDPGRIDDQVDSPGQFRRHLCDQHVELASIRDIADAHKHCELDRANRRLTSNTQAHIRSMGWGEAEYGIAEFGEAHAMVVSFDDGTAENFARIVWDAVEIWTALLE